VSAASQPRPRAGYHHGDLREALLEAAEALLREEGVPGLTLRACARRAGVSHAAPKHHFADLSELLSAVAARGFDRLTVALVDAREAAGDDPDRRFSAAQWDTPPFAAIRDSFLLTEAWWQEATTDLRGMSPANEAALSFAVRQALDMVAPSNFPHLNPEVLSRARDTQGARW